MTGAGISQTFFSHSFSLIFVCARIQRIGAAEENFLSNYKSLTETDAITACDRKHARRKVIQASPACINAIHIHTLYRKCFLFNSFLLLLNIFATKASSHSSAALRGVFLFRAAYRVLGSTCASLVIDHSSLFRCEQACTNNVKKSTHKKRQRASFSRACV